MYSINKNYRNNVAQRDLFHEPEWFLQGLSFGLEAFHMSTEDIKVVDFICNINVLGRSAQVTWTLGFT